jgi:non-ribosomal peptide synthetase component E (peptide arylation enzyme)
VRLRGPHLMRGYVDAKLDAEAFDAQGFLRTGDLGRLDADGYLTITGRLKDVIIRKGENISAKEVEDHLFAHPKVADVAVIGLPDAERGERVCAVVVSRDAADPLGFEEMSGFLRERGLALQKLPEQLERADALPRNAAGKVVKRELVARFASILARRS